MYEFWDVLAGAWNVLLSALGRYLRSSAVKICPAGQGPAVLFVPFIPLIGVLAGLVARGAPITSGR